MLAALPEVRIARWALIALGVAFAVGFPLVASPSQTNRGTIAIAFGLVAVSLVVLTGWGGVVSLGQVAILGVGGVVTANLIARWNLDLFWTIGAAAVAGALVALVIGLPALRVPGQFLAVTTMAFAVAMDLFIINPTNFRWLIPTAFDRPLLWKRFAMSGERPLYYVALGLLVVALWMVRGLRRARAGRVVDRDARQRPDGRGGRRRHRPGEADGVRRRRVSSRRSPARSTRCPCAGSASGRIPPPTASSRSRWR